MKTNDNQRLATVLYEVALRQQIEEDVKSKYLKRIDYLVGANNDLIHKLERCEKDRAGYASIADSILI
ncbi:MAG: hypothetical protein CXT73_03155 [Methanobacteriota archaeon]|jgi:hypothetical protein|nr:MAG: hypothetical protein CXT73_03155 [Euryarchaeota archaeon]